MKNPSLGVKKCSDSSQYPDHKHDRFACANIVKEKANKPPSRKDIRDTIAGVFGIVP